MCFIYSHSDNQEVSGFRMLLSLRSDCARLVCEGIKEQLKICRSTHILAQWLALAIVICLTNRRYLTCRAIIKRVSILTVQSGPQFDDVVGADHYEAENRKIRHYATQQVSIIMAQFYQPKKREELTHTPTQNMHIFGQTHMHCGIGRRQFSSCRYKFIYCLYL